MGVTNSFADSVNQLMQDVNVTLNNLVALNNSLTTQNDTVTSQVVVNNPVTGDSSVVSISMPSFNSIINKVNAVTNSIDAFISGNGNVVISGDNSFRQVSTTPIAIPPSQISSIPAPVSFAPRDNFFFSNLMFPQLTVKFNLLGQVDNLSEKLVYRRIIVDNTFENNTQWFLDNLVGKSLDFLDTITLLNTNGKKYYEDDQVIDLDLNSTTYNGNFLITGTQIINGKQYLTLDTLFYGLTTDSPTIDNIQLSVGTELRYNKGIFKIDDINTSLNAIHVIPIIGSENPTPSHSFYIYSSPFQSKIASIPINYNELNVIFLKGVNQNYYLQGDAWSNSISFYSNTLTLQNSNQTLFDFYNANVYDFGKQLLGQSIENVQTAFYGSVPNKPTLNVNNFSVVQINNQVNATLDTTSITQTQAQIETDKSLISSIQSTLAQQKSQLVGTTDPAARANLQSQIDTNTNTLTKTTNEYQSLVTSLSTLAQENSAVNINPLYRIRGFWQIPEPVNNEQVIGFDIAYRYLRVDNTANPLQTFDLTDASSGQVSKGVFTDWNINQSPILSKQYDASSGIYNWVVESISNGDTLNINQLDIDIVKGENVQIKIRSVGEAGYPINPLKSDWSDPIIVTFPNNLQGSDQVTNILNNALSAQNSVTIDQTLSSTGIYTHIDDSIPNPNSGNGTYFKHQAVNIAYDQDIVNHNGTVASTQTSDIQNLLENIPTLSYMTIVDPSSGTKITSTIQLIIQEIINASYASRPFNSNNI